MTLRLGSVQVFLEPCPHFVIDDVFESNFYNELVGRIPEFDGFDRSDAQATGTMALREFRALSDTHETLGRRLDEALLDLNKEVSALSREIIGKIRTREAYASYLELIEDAEWEEATYFRIRERGNGFSLPPHMDGPYFLSTHIVYLARNQDDAENGTAILAPDLSTDYDSLKGFLSMWPQHERWNIVKMVDYVPNRVFGFLNTPWSIHGHLPFSLRGRRLSINVTMKLTDKAIKNVFSRVPSTHRQFFAKPKILREIINGTDTLAEMKRDPEGRFAFLHG
jgi:hypothetical protein